MNNSYTLNIEKDRVPDEFINRCIAGHVGGAVVVFVTGKDVVEREKKVNELLDFVKILKVKYDTLPTA